MFTGIIERTARVMGVVNGPKFRRITLAVDWPDVRNGESVAVNGVCLTVAEMAPGELGFDVIAETLGKTNLGLILQDDDVHVERSLRIGDRIDGHFVQGHVDGTALLLEQIERENEWRLRLESPAQLAKYLTPKGSVTLDGVSLTIAAVNGTEFEVALIPTTLRLTLFDRRPVGWPFNLEADVLSKTVISWLERTYGSAEDGEGSRQ
ncbi:MAG: Riboflavin synthase eubacterial/eukaryotic [Phycisphaerales bacterium]|nr:Riboflavin synthase eubacterial/eukaryotic [Phycisphaerales bacterium]